MKRLTVALLLLLPLAGTSAPAYAAGVIPIALQQTVDKNGKPIVGAQLFIYQVGTVATRQDSFSDSGLTQALQWPLVTDANGRLPMFYLADGSVHARLTDAAGVVLFDYPSMLVIGASSGGGGGSTVDPTTIASTGDIKFRPTTEVLSGWVRLNGQTIGNATSGANGRANSDTQALFVYLWNNCADNHCPVVGGRGATGLADFNASKQLTLPDFRARTPVGLDDMGSTAAGRLQALNVTSPGDGVLSPAATGGEATHTLAQAELPAISPPITITDPGHSHNIKWSTSAPYQAASTGSPISTIGSGSNNGSSDSHTTGVTAAFTNNLGSGVAHNVMQPFMLGTYHMKL